MEYTALMLTRHRPDIHYTSPGTRGTAATAKKPTPQTPWMGLLSATHSTTATATRSNPNLALRHPRPTPHPARDNVFPQLQPAQRLRAHWRVA